MSWRLAKSLVQLRSECSAVAPDRRKNYDGTIGDAAHAARASRHNPNSYGVVTALDITHDPEHGMDTYDLYEYLRTHPHPNLWTIISHRRIARRDRNNFEDRPYTGSNPHTGHIHIGVGVGPDSNPQPPYDDTTPWGLSEWKEQDVDEATARQIAKEEASKLIDFVYADAEIDEAQNWLVQKKYLSKKHPPNKAATMGAMTLFMYRILKSLGK